MFRYLLLLVIAILTITNIWTLTCLDLQAISVIPTNTTDEVYFNGTKIGTGAVCIPNVQKKEQSFELKDLSGQVSKYELKIHDTSIENVPKTQNGLEISFENVTFKLGCD